MILMVMFAFGIQNVSAQDEQIKINTGSPDLKIKVDRCVASGNSVTIDLTLTNLSKKDVDARIFQAMFAGGQPNHTEAIDNQGNKYVSNVYKDIISLKIGNQNKFVQDIYFTLLSDIPVKVSVRIDGVSELSEAIARLNLLMYCEPLGIDHNHKVQIRNIPITRD